MADPTRLVLNAPQGGHALAEALQGRGIDVEMADDRRVVLICTAETTEDDLNTLETALAAIRREPRASRLLPDMTALPEKRMELRQAAMADTELVPLEKAAGRDCCRVGGAVSPGDSAGVRRRGDSGGRGGNAAKSRGAAAVWRGRRSDCMRKAVIFDLDGTLTQSEEGIFNCVKYAAEKLGFDIPDDATLHKFVGPPLDYSFRTFMGMDDEMAWKAVYAYRERYNVVGLFENRVYPGIRRLLRTLKAAGRVLRHRHRQAHGSCPADCGALRPAALSGQGDWP